MTKRITIIILAIVFILLLPLIATQFSAEAMWTLSDFVIAGALLVVAGTLLEVILRVAKSRTRQIIWILVLLAIFGLVWAELAVGLIGSPFAGS